MLAILVVYFGYRFEVEWRQSSDARRLLRISKIDHSIAHFIGLVALEVFLYQTVQKQFPEMFKFVVGWFNTLFWDVPISLYFGVNAVSYVSQRSINWLSFTQRPWFRVTIAPVVLALLIILNLMGVVYHSIAAILLALVSIGLTASVRRFEKRHRQNQMAKATISF